MRKTRTTRKTKSQPVVRLLDSLGLRRRSAGTPEDLYTVPRAPRAVEIPFRRSQDGPGDLAA